MWKACPKETRTRPEQRLTDFVIAVGASYLLFGSHRWSGGPFFYGCRSSLVFRGHRYRRCFPFLVARPIDKPISRSRAVQSEEPPGYLTIAPGSGDQQ